MEKEKSSEKSIKEEVKLFQYNETEIKPLTEKDYQPDDLSQTPDNIWSIQSIWNSVAEMTYRNEPKIRDYISFSDLGKKDYWSRYMKMTGVKETNLFDSRVLRIFSAGDEFHFLLKSVFKKVGIFIDSQDDLKNGKRQFSIIEPTQKTLKVLGSYDTKAGGFPDLEKALKWIDESDFSPFVRDKAEKIARYFAEKFANGLKEMIYEFKSINSLAFWNKKSYLLEAYPHHALQLYAALKSNSPEEGRLLYISKDDLTLAEFPFHYPDEKLEKLFNEDVETMSHYILNREEPPKPPYIVFDKRKPLTFQKDKKKYKVIGCFNVNWEVIRSPYFLLMTGYKNVEDFESKLKGEIADRNEEIKSKILQFGK